MELMVCYQKCSNQLGEWFYQFEPAAGSVPAVPPGQTFGGGSGCGCSPKAPGPAANATRLSAEPGGLFGPGWSSLLGVSLSKAANGAVTFRGQDGQRVVFEPLPPSDSYTRPPGAHASLVKSATRYTVTQDDRVTWSFDSSGRISRVTDRSGQGLTFHYRDSELVSVSDAAARSVTVTTSGGRITKLALPDGRSTAYAYSSGRLRTVRDAAGGVTTYAYNPAGYLTKITDPLGHVTTSGQYDNLGDPGQVTDARGNSSYYTYDAHGDVLTVTDPSGRQAFTYDRAGNLLTAQDQNLHTTTYTYDGKGQLVRVTDPDGRTWTSGYDGAGNLVRLTSPLGNRAIAGYDLTGRAHLGHRPTRADQGQPARPLPVDAGLGPARQRRVGDQPGRCPLWAGLRRGREPGRSHRSARPEHHPRPGRAQPPDRRDRSAGPGHPLCL